MKRIDFENHFFDPSAIQAFAARDSYPIYREDENIIRWADGVDMPVAKLLPLLLDVAERRVQAMDEAGITTAMLSSAPGLEDLDAATSVEVCRQTNDAMAEAMYQYPGRFIGNAILPVMDLPAALAEMERCVKKLGFVGWLTHSNYGDSNLSESEYRPLIHKAAELGIFIYLHPQLPAQTTYHDYGFTFGGPALGFTVDTMTTILKLIVSGALDEDPGLTVLLGHFGEAMPFLLDRIDNRLGFIPNEKLKNKHAPSYYFKNNIMVTTSGNMSPAAFRCTKEVLGIDRILFGSDYPFENAAEMGRFVDELELSREDRDKLNWKNAEALGIQTSFF